MKRPDNQPLYEAIELERNVNIFDDRKIGIFRDKIQVGEYERNYALGKSFFPFCQGGKWYALYSRHYTATRVMSLPDCVDLGGEVKSDNGFCPIEYFVPCIENGYNFLMGNIGLPDRSYAERDENVRKYSGTYGFVKGCVWQGPYLIMYLDLSQVSSGVFTREFKFRHNEAPDSIPLDKCIEIHENKGVPYYITLVTNRSYDFRTGEED